MKTGLMAFALLGTLGAAGTQAAIYLPPPDPVYEALSKAMFCMGYYNTVATGQLSIEAGLAAQSSVASQLDTLNKSPDVAEAVRLAMVAVSKVRKDGPIPIWCKAYIPQNNDATPEQLDYFLKHGADRP